MIFNSVLEYLEANPPSIMRWECELCGKSPLFTIAHRDRYGLPVRFQMCRFCGLVTLNPRWDTQRYAEFYAKYYRPLVSEYLHMQRITGSINAGEWFSTIARAVYLDSILPDKPYILEIGGAEGDAAIRMRDSLGGEVVIVEPNEGEARIAAEKGFDVIVDVFENASFSSSRFDLVVMLRTVDHLVDSCTSFSKMRDLLNVGGKVLLDGVDYFRRMAYSGDAITPLKIDHCYYFSPCTLPTMLAKCGLRPIVVDLNITPGQVVVLAQLDEAASAADRICEAEGDRRFEEWERFANRPKALPQGMLTRSVRSEIGWLWSRVRSKVQKSEKGHERKSTYY